MSRRQRKMKRLQTKRILENPAGIFGPGGSLKDFLSTFPSIRPKGKAIGGTISDKNLGKYMEQGSGSLSKKDTALLKNMYKNELSKYMKRNDGGIARKTRVF